MLILFYSFGCYTSYKTHDVTEVTHIYKFYALDIHATYDPNIRGLSNTIFVSTALAQVDPLLRCGVKKCK